MQVFDLFLRNIFVAVFHRNKNVIQQSHENVIEVYVMHQTNFKNIMEVLVLQHTCLKLIQY